MIGSYEYEYGGHCPVCGKGYYFDVGWGLPPCGCVPEKKEEPPKKKLSNKEKEELRYQYDLEQQLQDEVDEDRPY